MSSNCCDEPRCRRSQPIRLTHSGLTGRWYFVTRWKAHGSIIEALDKHYVGDQYQAAFDAMFPPEEAGDDE